MQISNRHMRQIHGEFKMKRLVPISFALLFMALTPDAFSRPARPSQIPDGDGVPVDGAVVTNPGDSASTPPPEGVIRVLSFAIAGQELAGDASNPPVDAGDQEVVIRFAEPVAFELSEDGSPVFDNLGVGFAPYLGIGEEVTNLSISGDGRTLTATVFLAENTAYQVLVGPTDPGSFDEHQVYYVGTSELPDVSITGRVIYPEDLAGRAGEGLAVVVLLDRERYELLQEEGQGFNPAMVKILAEASASRVTVSGDTILSWSLWRTPGRCCFL